VTPIEAAELLALMRATWPRLAQDEVADRLWLEDLVELDAEVAHKVWRRLRDREQRTPSWALFKETYDDRSQVGSHHPELEGPRPKPITKEHYQKIVAEREAALEARREERVMDRIHNRAPYPPVLRPGGFDATIPALTYDEVYDEDGNFRVEIGESA